MNDNAKKNKRGSYGKQSLESLVINLKEKGYIAGYKTVNGEWTQADSTGYRLYSPFVIEFADGEQWALYYTSSLRERIKQDRWDSFLMKRFRNINHCYTVIFEKEPPAAGQESDAEKADRLIRKARESADALPELDGAMTATDLYNLIEQRYAQQQEHGVREAVAGMNFETRLVNILNSVANLACWQGDELQVGQEYGIFAQVLNCWGCPREGVRRIMATSDIPFLPSGGHPKTDVLAVAYLADGRELRFTASLKKSGQPFVSGHQYTAQAFIEALDVQEENLRNHLELFQETGGVTAAEVREPGFAAAFTAEIRPYVRRLCEWVVTGEHGITSSPDQIARYVITFDNENMALDVCTAADYIDRMIREVPGQFGTHLTWTYPSKHRGQSIQLKMPVFPPVSHVHAVEPAWPH